MKILRTTLWIQVMLLCLASASSLHGQYYEQGQWIDFEFFPSHTGPLMDPPGWDAGSCGWTFDDFLQHYYLGHDSVGSHIELWLDWTSVDSLVGPCWLDMYCGASGIVGVCSISVEANGILTVPVHSFTNAWDWQNPPFDFTSLLRPGSDSDYVRIEHVGGYTSSFEIIRMSVTDAVIFTGDVGVLDIVPPPPDTVYPDSTYGVRAQITNNGPNAEDFDVECTITPAGYVDTLAIAGLSPGSVVDIAFEDWTVPPDTGIFHTICVVTLLVGDPNPRNDTLCKDVIAIEPEWRDMELYSLFVPDTVFAESSYSIGVDVINMGSNTETDILVELTIDPVEYAESLLVFSIPPGGLIHLDFPPWTVPRCPPSPCTVCATVIWDDDQDPSNDSLCREVVALDLRMHDVGPYSITSPPDTVEPDSAYVPTAWVANYGCQLEIFGVVCSIDTGGVAVYVDTVGVSGLMPDRVREVEFSSWTVPDVEAATYYVCVWTTLIGDQVPANDTLCGSAVTGIAEGAIRTKGSQVWLSQNKPNPFCGSTEIVYSIAAEGWVRLDVYDVSGRLTERLVDGVQMAGEYRTAWHPDDIEPGVYFSRLTADGQTVTRKMVLIM